MQWMGRVLTLLVASVVPAAMAQAQYAPLTLQATVPFEFTVGQKSFPAGDYIIQRSGPHALTLRDANGKFLTVVQTNQVQSLHPHGNAGIKFRSIGERRALEQVWQGGMSTGYQLYVPKDRKSLVAARTPIAERTASVGELAGKR